MFAVFASALRRITGLPTTQVINPALLGSLALCSCLSVGLLTAQAAVTADQKKELAELKSAFTKVATLAKGKKVDDAEKLLSETEERLEKFTKEHSLEDSDPALSPVRKALEAGRTAIQKASGGKSGKGQKISFSQEVAEIIADNCVKCHGGNNPRANLNLSTFAGMEKGGRNGPLLVPGRPQLSLLMMRVVNPQERMPKDSDPLSEEQIRKLAQWIQEGAAFDGPDKDMELADLKKLDPAGKDGSKDGKGKGKAVAAVEIPKPTGSETVSFVKDIALELRNKCQGCHSGANPRSGFSVETFEKMMIGGDSGKVIIPGKLNESRLWRLINGDDTPVMPAGQNRIKRQWYDNLKTWILEGARYDGGDPRKRLNDLLPSDEELRAAELAKLTPDEWVANRKQRTAEQWKRTLPSQQPVEVETDEFLLVGNVTELRLKQVAEWAGDHLKTLKSMFNEKDSPAWKGKLAIFVFKERFDFEEFNLSVYRREVPREILAVSDVSANFEDAMIALEDVGDEPSDKAGGLQTHVIEQLTGAFIRRGGGKLPDWLVRGVGLHIAGQAKSGHGNAYLASLRRQVPAALKGIDGPDSVFEDGTFSPSDTVAVGYTLVEFLFKNGGAARFAQLVKRLQAGDEVPKALQTVYGADCRVMGLQYASNFSGGGTPRKKK